MRYRILAVLAVYPFLLSTTVAMGQSAPGPKTDCQKADPVISPTKPEAGPSSGTAPGNAGSTGWTGGTGGSHIGTSPSGPTQGSEQDHPATAKGLDPTKPESGNNASKC